MPLGSRIAVNTWHYIGAISPSYAALFESTTNTAPNCGRRGVDDRP